MMGLPGQIFLTNYAASQAGSMWNPCALDLTQSFDLAFGVNFGVNTCSGDGVAFVLQNQGTNALGANSGEHGYGGITNSLAVAFDTYSNSALPYNDPSYDSLDLQISGGASYAGPSACGGTGWAGGTCARPSISAAQLNVKDGLNHSVDIQWNPSTFTLSVQVDGAARAAWVLPANVVTQIFGGNSQVYYGFTGSTGGTYNRQEVAQTSLNTNPCSYTPTPTFAFFNTPLPAATNMCPATTNTPTNSPTPTSTRTRSVTPGQDYTPTNSPTPTSTQTRTVTPFEDYTPTASATAVAGPGGPVPWVLVGSAKLGIAGLVYLTDNAASQFGGMWNPCPLPVAQSFDLSFAMNFGVNSCGSDGIEFMLQPDSTSQLGSNAGSHGADGAANSLEVEFDTYQNAAAPYDDPPYDSLGLQTEGNIAALVPANCGGADPVSGTCGRPAISATQSSVKDGLNHAVEIRWTVSGNTTLTVIVDGSTRAAWVFTPAQVSAIFGANSSVWYGFTAATGGSWNRQSVAQTSVNSNPCGYTATPTFAFVYTPLPAQTDACPATATRTATPSPTHSPTCTPGGATRSPTLPATLGPKADPPPGRLFAYPQPCHGGPLHFAYFMRGPGQANLHVFNAAGVALGGLNEHRDAGPEVGTLQVTAFADGVYYYEIEIRYDSGEREMLKAGKFLIVRP